MEDSNVEGDSLYSTISRWEKKGPSESPLRGMFLIRIKFGCCGRRTFVSNDRDKKGKISSQCPSKSPVKKAQLPKACLKVRIKIGSWPYFRDHRQGHFYYWSGYISYHFTLRCVNLNKSDK